MYCTLDQYNTKIQEKKLTIILGVTRISVWDTGQHGVPSYVGTKRLQVWYSP